jgi:hypothetical protein
MSDAKVQELSLEDINALAPLLQRPERLPEFVRNAVLDYQDNKGTRGWDFPDRRIVPLAWKEADKAASGISNTASSGITSLCFIAAFCFICSAF